MRKPTIYRAVPMRNRDGSTTWGVRGAWKTVNSSMGSYPTQAAAEKAIAERKVQVLLRRVTRIGR